MSQNRTSTPAHHMRWMIRRDIDAVVEIERACANKHMKRWGEKQFIDCLRQRNAIGHIVEIDEKVVGYIVYMLNKVSLEIVRIGVHPSHTNVGVANLMLERLKAKISPAYRHKLLIEVEQHQDQLIRKLSHSGFRAMMLDSDTYVFTYSVEREQTQENVQLKEIESEA